MKSTIEFHANGKLLLTGEYLVLAGAKALALPVRFGQQMIIRETAKRVVDWESRSVAGTWFSAWFDPVTLKFISTDNKRVASDIEKLLLAARWLNPGFLTGPAGWKVVVNANYPLEWGLGSSSTLISLVAAWAGVQTFDLFRKISKGSGYDIACAGQQGLLYYQLRKGRREITPARAGSALRENTWFTYLGNKQDSAREAAAFLLSQNYTPIDLAEVSRLSTAICDADSPEELIKLVDEHEFILSTILKREPIAGRFRTFPGTVKSLGAWGGDFAMFVSGMEREVVNRHLHQAGFDKIFSYNDIEIQA
ncbi:MAG: GYDIA family GHMP kinase [Bacteroidetes bacterium]|nr:GYDIA family GHMP kinase [Bacteroidota bacterium]